MPPALRHNIVAVLTVTMKQVNGIYVTTTSCRDAAHFKERGRRSPSSSTDTPGKWQPKLAFSPPTHSTPPEHAQVNRSDTSAICS